MDNFEMENEVMEQSAEALEAAKQKKRDAAKRHNEKVKADAAARKEAAQVLKDELTKLKIWDKISEDMKDFIEKLANPVTTSSAKTGVFVKLFGADPKEGDSISLSDAFTKTFKGKATLDRCVKQWAEKGIIVEFKENTANMLDSTYTIVKLA